VQSLQPLCITDVGLASGYVLGIARIDEEHCKATGVEELKDRDPIDAGRFHDDRVDAALGKPVHQPMQISGEGTEAAHRLRCAICIHGSHVHGGPDVDRGRVCMDHQHRTAVLIIRFVPTHCQSSNWGGRAGLRC
jgi:hypothetical protein